MKLRKMLFASLLLCTLTNHSYADPMVKSLAEIQEMANQGNALAQFSLGMMYEREKNDQKSFEWYEKAAQQDHTFAQYQLAKIYLEGKGVDKNQQKAFEWFKQSAELGEVISQSQLGDM